MARVRDILANLNLGKSVAEFDDALDKYFVETNAFRELINDKVDIIAGDKGTGKTAICRILQKQYASIPNFSEIEVLTAFNPMRNPVFQKLGDYDTQEEGDYIRLWKTYVLSLAGNWLLSIYGSDLTPSMQKLDKLLQGLDIRETSDTPATIFTKVTSQIGGFFRWKSASVEMSVTDTGFPAVTPRVEFRGEGDKADDRGAAVNVEAALRLLDQALGDAGYTLWIAIDRLDEAFQGFPQIEIPALRALLRTYLDLIEFPRIRLKLFLRRDLFRRIVSGGFVNLTHVNAKKFELIWDEEDLLNLLCRRIRENRDFCAALGITEDTNPELFAKVFPNQVDIGKRKPVTWTWMMRRIRDGNDIKPPRNLIDLISMALQAQLRREERENSREYDSTISPIEGDSLRRGLSQLSKQRVLDTLLAEAGVYSPLIEKFRDGKAEHNTHSLAAILQVQPEAVRSEIQPLLDIGFLEDVKGTYKIPALYREGLNITQGKAFDAGSGSEDEDEE